MLKKGGEDVWMQNLRLSMLTLPFATLTMVATDWSRIQTGGLFQGWTPLVWAITVGQHFDLPKNAFVGFSGSRWAACGSGDEVRGQRAQDLLPDDCHR